MCNTFTAYAVYLPFILVHTVQGSATHAARHPSVHAFATTDFIFVLLAYCILQATYSALFPVILHAFIFLYRLHRQVTKHIHCPRDTPFTYHYQLFQICQYSLHSRFLKPESLNNIIHSLICFKSVSKTMVLNTVLSMVHWF